MVNASSCTTDFFNLAFFSPFPPSDASPSSDRVLCVHGVAPAPGPQGLWAPSPFPASLRSRARAACTVPIPSPALAEDFGVLSLNSNLKKTCFGTAKSSAFLPSFAFAVWSQCSQGPRRALPRRYVGHDGQQTRAGVGTYTR